MIIWKNNIYKKNNINWIQLTYLVNNVSIENMVIFKYLLKRIKMWIYIIYGILSLDGKDNNKYGQL